MSSVLRTSEPRASDRGVSDDAELQSRATHWLQTAATVAPSRAPDGGPVGGARGERQALRLPPVGTAAGTRAAREGDAMRRRRHRSVENDGPILPMPAAPLRTRRNQPSRRSLATPLTPPAQSTRGHPATGRRAGKDSPGRTPHERSAQRPPPPPTVARLGQSAGRVKADPGGCVPAPLRADVRPHSERTENSATESRSPARRPRAHGQGSTLPENPDSSSRVPPQATRPPHSAACKVRYATGAAPNAGCRYAASQQMK